jgi:hypothetical protein
MTSITVLIAVHFIGVAAHGPSSPRPGFIALRAADGRPKASEGAADCDLACGDHAPKNCVADCNSAIVQCVTAAGVSDTKATHHCRNEVLTTIKKVRTLSLREEHNKTLSNHAAPNKTLANNTAILASDRKAIGDDCAGVCGDNVNSSCITSCEMEMYSCINSTLPDEVAEGKRDECFEKVLKKYEGFKEEWNATHGFVAHQDVKASRVGKSVARHDINVATKNATVHYTVTDADQKMIKDVCDAACTKAGDGAPSSMCVTHCRTEMYRCIKETLPDEMDERKKCRADTQAKYEAWGSSL